MTDRYPSDWQREYLGIPWRPTAEEIQLRKLAEQYHERTEAYDRTVCTGPVIRCGIMPAGFSQWMLVQRNASLVRRELYIDAAELGFTQQQWQDAISQASFHHRTKS